MIYKLFTFIVLLFFTAFTVKAQVKLSFGADSNDVISNVVLDKFGNFYIAANFSNTIIFNKDSKFVISSQNKSQDILLAKFNAIGKIIWFKKIGGDGKDEVRDLKIDTYGNLYVIGSFTNECQFENSLKKNKLISNGKNDGFIAKYLSTTGDLDWATQIGGEYDDDISSICIDNLNGIIISGRFTKLINANNTTQKHLLIATTENINHTSAYLARINTYDGKLIFANTIGITNNNNPFQSQSCVEIDEKNNFYLLTTFTDEIDINPNGTPIKYISKGKNDLILIKFDINGKILESLSFGGSGNENCNNKCLAINKKNELTIAISFQENCKVITKNKSINLIAKAETDLAIIKLKNKLSDIIYNCTFSLGDAMNNNQIIIDELNQTWVVGYAKIKYKPETKTKQKSVPVYIAPTNKYFIYKLDNNGSIITQKINNFATENCAIHTIQFNNFTKDLFIGGNYSNTFDFNDYTFKSKGKKDFFVLKLNENLSNWKLNKSDTSSILTSENFTIDVKSNSTSTLLNIKYFSNKIKNQSLSLIDYKGNILKLIDSPKQNSGLQQIFFDISFLPTGQYFIKQNNISKSFIKN